MRLKLPIKLKRPGKRQLIILAGLLLATTGTYAAWRWLPQPAWMQQALARVGLKATEGQGVAMRLVPASQSQGDGATTTDSKEAPRNFLLPPVRLMLKAQTALAMGEPKAGETLKLAMADVAAAAARDARGLTPEDVDAAAIYVLSGGRPELLQRIVAEAKLDSDRRAAFEGALSFAKNDLPAAAKQLEKVKPEKFTPVLAARFEMLAAQLEDKAPYAARRDRLAKAVTLVPGTLLEEAATRRLVALAAENAAVPDLIYWADRYQRRFPDSLYFAEFWASTLNGIFAFEKNRDKISLAALHALVARLPQRRKVGLARQLILRSIREGQPRLCQFGFDEAVDSAGKTGQDVERLRLYRLACGIATEPQAVDAQLALLDRSKLDADDVQLLEAARLLLRGITAATTAAPDDVQIYGPRPGYPGIDDVKQRSASVAQQIEATNQVLKRAEQ